MIMLTIDGLGDVLIEPKWLGLSESTPKTLNKLDRLSRLNVSAAKVCQVGTLRKADFVMVPIPKPDGTSLDQNGEGGSGGDRRGSDRDHEETHAHYRHMLDKSRAMNLELDRRLNMATERTAVVSMAIRRGETPPPGRTSSPVAGWEGAKGTTPEVLATPITTTMRKSKSPLMLFDAEESMLKMIITTVLADFDCPVDVEKLRGEINERLVSPS